MALVPTTAGIVHGSDASLDDNNIGTILLWVYPFAVGAAGRFTFKGAAGNIHTFLMTADGDLQMTIQGSTNFVKESSPTPLAAINRWQCIAADFSFGVSGAVYAGFDTLTALAMAVDQNGSTPGSDAAANLIVGATGAAGAFNGAIGFIGIWRDRMLTMAEKLAMMRWSKWLAGITPFQPLYEPIPSGNVLFCPYGQNGVTTQIDYSPYRNHSVSVGASFRPPQPVTDPFPWIAPSLIGVGG